MVNELLRNLPPISQFLSSSYVQFLLGLTSHSLQIFLTSTCKWVVNAVLDAKLLAI